MRPEKNTYSCDCYLKPCARGIFDLILPCGMPFLPLQSQMGAGRLPLVRLTWDFFSLLFTRNICCSIALHTQHSCLIQASPNPINGYYYYSRVTSGNWTSESWPRLEQVRSTARTCPQVICIQSPHLVWNGQIEQFAKLHLTILVYESTQWSVNNLE